MTREELLKITKELGNDIILGIHGNHIEIEVNDFEEFDDDYGEIYREIENPILLHYLIDRLESTCLSRFDTVLYTTYVFKDFDVSLGFTSYNI